MECNCGGGTKDHQVVRAGEVIGNYIKCTGCGRIEWLWKHKDFERLIKGAIQTSTRLAPRCYSNASYGEYDKRDWS